VIAIDHRTGEGLPGQSWNLVGKLGERIEPAPDLQRRASRPRRRSWAYHSLFEKADSEQGYGDTPCLGFAGDLALYLGRNFERDVMENFLPDQYNYPFDIVKSTHESE
jgi:hypothetical protein